MESKAVRVVSLRLTEDEVKILDEQAQRAGKNRSDYLRSLFLYQYSITSVQPAVAVTVTRAAMPNIVWGEYAT